MSRRGNRLVGDRTRIPVPGPLAAFTDEFRADLTAQGFKRHVVADHTHLLAHLSEWLAERGLTAGDVDADVLQRFLSDRRAGGHKFLISARGMAPMLKYLRGLGVVPQAGAPTPVSPAEVLLAEYGRYLAVERSLAPLSVDRYLVTARLFVSGLPSPMEVSLQQLSAVHVTDSW